MTVSRERFSPKRRRAARLAAVQALYEMEIGSASVDEVLDGFARHRWKSPDIRMNLPEPDSGLLDKLVRGAASDRIKIDAMIGSALAKSWTVDRLEVLLRSILRVGALELSTIRETPESVIISEYVDLAHAFFSGKEPTLVNAVLDRLARTLRSGEAESTDGSESRRAQ